MSPNFIALHNTVLILPRKQSERDGSVIIPATSLHAGTFAEKGGTVGQYMDRGTVAVVGTGHKYGNRFTPDHSGSVKGTWELVALKKRTPLAVKKGDDVLFLHKAGQDVVIDGVTYRVVPESQIEAILGAEE